MIKSQTVFKISGYFIRYDGLNLPISDKELPGKKELPVVILLALVNHKGILIWENQGVFKLIPEQVLRNAKLNHEASRQLKKEYPRTKKLDSLKTISWEQGVPVTVNYLLA
jgi:hypothetical protein